MSGLSETRPTGRLDWDAAYRDGNPPWETGVPAAELLHVLDEGLVPPGIALEIGCGTGSDAIALVKRGFEVTAVDSSPMAIERARVRAEREDVLPRFVLADIYEFAATAGQFDFVYDAGLYQFVRQHELGRYLDVLWRVTRPGSLYLTLAGDAGEPAQGGPPRVTKRQICRELGRLLEVVQVTNCRQHAPGDGQGSSVWSCLMRRPLLSQPETAKA